MSRLPGDVFRSAISDLDAAMPPTDPADRLVLPCQAPRVRIRLALKDDNYNLIRGGSYKLKVGEEEFSGELGEPPIIDHLVPAKVEKGLLELTIEGQKYQLPFHIAAVDPLPLATGADVRLDNLLSGRNDPQKDLASKIRSLQSDFTQDDQLLEEASVENVRSLLERVYSLDDTPMQRLWTPAPSISEEAETLLSELPELNIAELPEGSSEI